MLWSNSFSWTQNVVGETPKNRSFLIDGETAVVDMTLRRGIGANADLGLRVPLLGRGGGTLDGLIDAWHRLARVPNGDRPSFVRDAFRVEGRTTAGEPFSWNDAQGWGLGDLELEGRFRIADGGADQPSVTFVGRLALPTGTGPYAGGGLGAAGQVTALVPLTHRFTFFGGMGVTAQDPGAVRGVEYETARIHAYAALEWRTWRWLSLLLETNAASRLVANVESYPGTHWLDKFGGRVDLGQRSRLDAFMTENLISQQSTTDIAFYLALTLRP